MIPRFSKRTPIALTMIASCGIASSALAAICDVSAFSCPTTGTCVITGTWNVGSSCTLDFGTRAVELKGTLQADVLGGGFSITAGDLTLNNGKLKSIGDSAHTGGEIDVVLSGALAMTGSSPRVDVGGTAGGGTFVAQAASIAIGAGVVTAEGGSGATCGDGGLVFLSATNSLQSGGSLRATTPGADCGGGRVALQGASVIVSGDVDARGGAFASEEAITITAATGAIQILSGAALWADGTGQPDGFGADGGNISLSAPNGAVVLFGSAISATGKSPDGSGGGLFVFAGASVELGAPFNARSGNEGVGGTLSVETVGPIAVLADVDVSGGSSFPVGAGGTVELRTPDSVDVTADIDASGASGGLAAIEAFDASTLGGEIAIAGDVIVRGARGDGGLIRILSCDVEIASKLDTGTSNGGIAGSIDVAGHDIAVLPQANLRALPCAFTECTAIFYGTSGSVVVDPAAIVTPAALIAIDPDLPAC